MEEDEFQLEERKLEIEEKEDIIKDENARRDAQRHMAWFALFGMLFYPFAIIVSSYFGLDKAVDALSDIAPTYFVSVAAIVAAFYGFDKIKK